MPKPYTNPTLLNEVLQLSITKLKEWDYLSPNQLKSGVINWSRNEQKNGSITIRVNTQTAIPYIELDYNFRDEPRNYKVSLVSLPSNLGKGVIWYFLCPQTNRRCRKLYSIGGYFYHRNAFNGCMYESQIQSKKYRHLDSTLGAYFKSEQLYEQLYKKHFKKTYAGKPTKRYLRLIQQIQQAERISYRQIEKLLIS